MGRVSLKTKMAACIFLFFFTLVPIAAGYLIDYFEGQLKKSLAVQQAMLISREADGLDHKFSLVHSLLIEVAQKRTPPEIFGHPATAQRFLDNRLSLQSVFGGGLFCLDAAGRLVAETAVSPPRVGVDYSYRSYVQRVIRERRPVISDPVVSSLRQHHPSVMFAAPVFYRDGRLAGILGGSFDLLQPNFIGDLAKARIGQSGYFYLIDYDRTLIMHPDRERIMKRDAPPGSNLLLDRAFRGFEGGGETVNSRGVHMLTSFKRLRSVPWILAANLPPKEAYGLIEQTKRGIWISITVAGCLLALLVWLIMRRLAAPLLSLTAQVRDIARLGRVEIKTGDEIGDLAEAFNRQLEVVADKERTLLQERELFQTLADFSSDWVFWRTGGGEMLYNSPACETITGYSAAELNAQPLLMDRMLHPDDTARWLDHVHRADQGGNPLPIEFRIITATGEARWIDHVCRRIFDRDGRFLGTRGSNRDITDRREAEEELQQQTDALRQEIIDREGAEAALAVQKRQLEELNSSLAERIESSVAELRQKDQVMITQSRQAAMGEMIGNIAHQWRQPLNALGLLLANIREAYRFGELDGPYLEQAVADGNRMVQKMSSTINDFRNFFRPAKASVPFSARQQIGEAIALVESSFASERIAIRLEADHDLTLIGYPNEYSQALLNLLANAKDAIQSSGVAPGVIQITLSERAGMGCVTVRDNGGGIPVESLDRIFEPYYSTKEMGTGIGLYMSKMIVERNMGGTIHAANLEGGAEFTILTPLATR